MTEYNILAVGEVLFDVIDGTYNLGGAPFNVAAHMAKLGNQSYMLSAVGEDELGERIIREVNELNVNTEFLYQNPDQPTGIVKVTFHDGEPEYDIVQNVAWDYIQTDTEELEIIHWSVITFGSLAQRSEHNQIYFRRLFDHLTADWIYFDCNLRQNYYNKSILIFSLRVADIAKFNEHEIKVVSEILYGSELDPVTFARKLTGDFGIALVVYTWGKDGSKAWDGNRLYSVPSIDIKTQDTVGAGDAFSAGFLHSLIHGKDVEVALKNGNRLGGYVASQVGAIPKYDEEIANFFHLTM